MKDKTTAALLAFFLGPFGAHKWYLEQPGGCAYPFFSLFLGLLPVFWIISVIEGISFLAMSSAEFDRRYNRVAGTFTASSSVVTTTVVHGPAGNVVVERRFSSRTPGVDVPTARPVNIDLADAQEPVARQRQAPGKEYATRKPRSQEERERFVLQAAADRDGVLTPSELALVTQMNIREAKQALDELHTVGACSMEVDDETGLLTYTFSELMPREQPRQSRLTGRSTQRLEEELND